MKKQVRQEFAPDQFQMVDASISNIKIENKTGEQIAKEDIAGFKMQLESGSAFNPKENLFQVKLKISLDGLNQQSEVIGVEQSVESEFVFFSENLRGFFEEKKGIFTLTEPALEPTLFALSYSTLRGMMIHHLKNSPFEKVILPIIHPSKLIASKPENVAP